MTKSKVLEGKLKQVKKLEKQVKTLQSLRKLFCKLEKENFKIMQEILNQKFSDEIFYICEDEIKQLEKNITELTN